MVVTRGYAWAHQLKRYFNEGFNHPVGESVSEQFQELIEAQTRLTKNGSERPMG